MNKNKLFLAVFLMVVSVCAAYAQAPLLKRTITKTDKFDFGPGGTVMVAGAPNGSIRITASTRNEVEITAEIALQAASEADLTRLAEVTGFLTDESAGRTGIISFGTYNKLGDKKLWKKFPKTLLNLPLRIDYVISVPYYCDLEVDGGVGALSISGVEGSLRVNYLETVGKIEVIGGNTTATIGKGSLDVALGVKGWRARSANLQVAVGDLTVKLPTNTSAEIDALVLRTGAIENTLPDLKPRNRKVPFTPQAILARAGAGGTQLKFGVGDGTLKMMPLTPPY